MGRLHFLYNVANWGYRRIATIVTAGFWIAIVFLGVVFSSLATVILAVLGFLWGVSLVVLTVSRRHTEKTAKWTFRTIGQQIKDWREGRRRRKEVLRAKEYGSV